MMLDIEWRKTLRTSWTVRINAIGAAIMATLAGLSLDPVTLLGVWNMMPPALQRIMPVQLVAGIGAVLFVLSFLARIRPKAGK